MNDLKERLAQYATAHVTRLKEALFEMGYQSLNIDDQIEIMDVIVDEVTEQL